MRLRSSQIMEEDDLLGSFRASEVDSPPEQVGGISAIPSPQSNAGVNPRVNPGVLRSAISASSVGAPSQSPNLMAKVGQLHNVIDSLTEKLVNMEKMQKQMMSELKHMRETKQRD